LNLDVRHNSSPFVLFISGLTKNTVKQFEGGFSFSAALLCFYKSIGNLFCPDKILVKLKVKIENAKFHESKF
jgi:hypothetical protein